MPKSQEELDMLKYTFGKAPNGDGNNQEVNKGEDNKEEKQEEKQEIASKNKNKEINSELDLQVTQSELESEEQKSKEEDIDTTDDEIIALLKKKGIDVSSLEDLKPKVDPAIESEKRESKKITYALEKGIISKREYDAYISDNSNRQSVVFAEFSKEEKENDPDLTEEEILEKFNETFFLNAEEGSLKYKRGQRLLNKEADAIIKERHGKYFEIDSIFDTFEKESIATTNQAKKIKEQTPIYTKSVEDSISQLSKLTFKLGDSSFTVSIPEKTLTDVKKSWMNEGQMEKAILSGMSSDEIKGAIEMTILKGSFESIINSVANKKIESKAKGTQGIPTDINLRNEGDKNKKTFSAGEIEYFKQAGLPIPAGAN